MKNNIFNQEMARKSSDFSMQYDSIKYDTSPTAGGPNGKSELGMMKIGQRPTLDGSDLD